MNSPGKDYVLFSFVTAVSSLALGKEGLQEVIVDPENGLQFPMIKTQMAHSPVSLWLEPSCV